MRKLILLLAFVVAGQAGLCAFGSEASAQIVCTLTNSETKFQSDKENCKKTCAEAYQKTKKPQEIPGCQAACDNVFKICIQRKKEAEDQDKQKKQAEEKKKADDEKANKEKEAKLKDLDHQKYLCRKPYTDCLLKCPQGNNEQNKKCEDVCNKSEAFTHYEACIKKLVP